MHFVAFLSLCMHVCVCLCNAVTFESLYLESSFFGKQVHFQNFKIGLYVKVTGAAFAGGVP